MKKNLMRAAALLISLSLVMSLTACSLEEVWDGVKELPDKVKELFGKEESEPEEASSEAETKSAPTEDSKPAPTEESSPAPTKETTAAPTEETKPTPTEDSKPAPTEAIEPAPTEATEPDPTEATEPAPTEATEPAPTEATEPAPTEATEPAPTEPDRVALTESEAVSLAVDFLNHDANGFLQSVYADARAASLYEVIYQMKDDTVASLVTPELFAKYGYQYESDTGKTYVSGAILDAFLQKTIGYGLADMCSVLHEWMLYFPEEDIYLIQHGDTNFQPVRVVFYEWDGKQLALHYTSEWGSEWYFCYGDVQEDYMHETASMMKVVLDYKGDGTFHIISNQCEITYDAKNGTEAEIEHLFNTFVVNGILQSSFSCPEQLDIGSIVSQWGECRDGDAYDPVELYEKYGKVWDDGPGCQMVSGATMEAFLRRYTGADFERFDGYKTGCYFPEEDLYYSREGGVTYEKVAISDVTEDYGNYYVRYYRSDGFESEFRYYDTFRKQIRSAGEMIATLTRDTYGRLIFLENAPT